MLNHCLMWLLWLYQPSHRERVIIKMHLGIPKGWVEAYVSRAGFVHLCKRRDSQGPLSDILSIELASN
jgi:hypothetical protein